MLPPNIYFTFQRFIWIRDGNIIILHHMKKSKAKNLIGKQTSKNIIHLSYCLLTSVIHELMKVQKYEDLSTIQIRVQNKLNFPIFEKI